MSLPTIIRKVAILLFPLALFMVACATTVPVQVEKAPTLDTSNISRIAIMPFGASSNRNIYNRMARYITDTARKKIEALDRFILVDHTVIEQLKDQDESLEGHVDALLSGRVTNIKESVHTSDRQVVSKDGVARTIFIRRRDVEIEFNYYLTRVSDGRIIGPVFRSSTYSSGYTRGDPPSSLDLLRSVANRQLRFIGRDLVPYTVIERRKLEKEPSNDKELRVLMRNAQSQVRTGNYKAALESYLSIYARYGNIAAARNISILQEALGIIQDADPHQL